MTQIAAYTRADLTIMQNWPLERKIQVTQAKILEWYYRHDGMVSISFSGGKDSTVLLDLVRRAFPDVPAVFADTGLEYPEIRAFVKSVDNVTWLRPSMSFPQVLDTYGFSVISKEVAEKIYYASKGSNWAINQLQGLNCDGTASKFTERFKKWDALRDAPFLISHKCCLVMKEKPLNSHTKESGRVPFIDTMTCESFRRQNSYLKVGCNDFDKKRPSSQPLSFWTEQDILRYLKQTGIPYTSVYGDIVPKGQTLLEGGVLETTGLKRTGCMFCMFGVHLEKTPNRFQKMQITHPKLHDYCINKLGCGAVLDYIGVPYLQNE